MEKHFSKVYDYGYIIAEVNGRKDAMLSEADYNTLKQCESLEEMGIKLSRTYRCISEGMAFSKPELRRRLVESLKEDFAHYDYVQEGDLRLILDYYIEYHKIQNFFYLLQCKQEDPDLERSFDKIEMGDFSALRTLKFSKDMNDVQKYCIENSFLSKFGGRVKFEKEFSDNNFQVLQMLFFKHHIEETYSRLGDDMEHMREILKLEGDRQIIEIAVNTLSSKDIVGSERKRLFPTVCSISLKTRDMLANVESFEDLKAALSAKYRFDSDISSVLIRNELIKCYEAFNEYNNLSCVYSYFKIKDREIKNILWIAECIIQGRKDAMSHIIVVR
jgi:V-type H+-transporting ATPase subunit d